MNFLDDRAVVVTGAGRGLGAAFARHAAAAGAAVVVNDIDGELAEEVARGIRESAGNAVASAHSVADAEQADALIEQCVAEFGGIDGLVNNAGLNYKSVPWEDDPARIRALIEVNVLGSLYCGVAAAKAMRRGSILNIASGSLLGQRNAAAYSASKGAIASMTFSWAVDLAPRGIRVNALCPIAWTRMVWDDPKGTTADQTPERIAPAVTYLLSDLAAGVTGQLVRFHGDRLQIVRQPAVKEPLLTKESWGVEDIADAFGNELADALEPPPSARW
ncbi:SDR family oxidoreductase [Amycolatopsis sp.]|uniref:SDR family NAD(P)-dependent oxidoreductase n=1 Tax=Amycolatopsis sp. TaxID=37632 RepID=UPI002E0AA696|nr:SDR family oxidoreductase [Amycolatopsis sp.]